MDITELTNFLKKAKKYTYASQEAKKVTSQRLNSKDYEYGDGELIYHDTYFGRTCFIGEEIVYKKNIPIWGMNYNGFTLDESTTEAEINKSLRGALKQDYNNIIPVRGPQEYIIDNYKYTNTVQGNLSRFEGREEITKDGNQIYYALFHGGLIQ